MAVAPSDPLKARAHAAIAFHAVRSYLADRSPDRIDVFLKELAAAVELDSYAAEGAEWRYWLAQGKHVKSLLAASTATDPAAADRLKEEALAHAQEAAAMLSPRERAAQTELARLLERLGGG